MAQAIVITVLLAARPATHPDTLVVCPERFREAFAPWVEHRRSQGRHIVLLRSRSDPRHIRTAIRDRAGSHLRFIVLVGDAAPDAAASAPDALVPTFHVRARVNIHWGSESHIASDDVYADLDSDGVPDVAIGRLSCDSPEELRQVIGRILRYEKNQDFGTWRRRINFVAGVGDFGAMADRTLELATKAVIRQHIPPGYSVSMTYASPSSPYCPHPLNLRRTALERLNEGCLFWAYIGHGHVLSLDRPAVHDDPLLTHSDMPLLNCRRGQPIAALWCCYAGAFDANQDCLAEQMLRAPGGPVAVLAGSRVTMPYGMAVLGTELLHAVFRDRHDCLGMAILSAKQQLLRAEQPTAQRAALDQIAASLSPRPAQLAEERHEHMHLFNLLGDPLLRIKVPQPLRVTVPRLVAAGQRLTIHADSPIRGRAVVELARRRGSLPQEAHPSPRNVAGQSASRESSLRAYQAANETRLAAAEMDVGVGRFHAALPVPREARGTCRIRIFVEGTDNFAVGSAPVRIVSDRTARLPGPSTDTR